MIYEYLYQDNMPGGNGIITIDVKESERTYTFKLIKNTCRYSPAHIDMMFSKGDTVRINKDRSAHAITFFDDKDFVIYPYRAGIPFLFKKKEI